METSEWNQEGGPKVDAQPREAGPAGREQADFVGKNAHSEDLQKQEACHGM